MTDKEKLELAISRYDAKVLHDLEKQGLIKDGKLNIQFPAPTQDGTAEEVYIRMTNEMPWIISDNVRPYVIEAIETYAAPLRAEIERLKNLIRSYDNGKEHYAKRCESLLAELTAANQQIAGLVQTIESHREQRELDRICYENRLAEANQRIAELEEQNKKYWFMIEHGLGVEDITPPSYPHP